VATGDETAAAQKIREALAIYQQSSDLIQLGAHVQGTNPKLDQSIRVRPQLLDFLKQTAETHTSEEETKNRLFALAKELA
jgi:flagellar biosynthesis/type III secretory pathway ATPase